MLLRHTSGSFFFGAAFLSGSSRYYINALNFYVNLIANLHGNHLKKMSCIMCAYWH